MSILGFVGPVVMCGVAIKILLPTNFTYYSCRNRFLRLEYPDEAHKGPV